VVVVDEALPVPTSLVDHPEGSRHARLGVLAVPVPGRPQLLGEQVLPRNPLLSSSGFDVKHRILRSQAPLGVGYEAVEPGEERGVYDGRRFDHVLFDNLRVVLELQLDVAEHVGAAVPAHSPIITSSGSEPPHLTLYFKGGTA